MGEAKRRKTSERQPQYRDLTTGELHPARDGGDPEVYLASMAQGPQPPVPCNGCATCCYHTRVDVYPDQERPEDVPFFDTETDPDGAVWLRKRADGACVHLADEGCSIYEHRPQSCRRYDCRIWSLFGTTDGMEGDRHTPVWNFRPRTRRGRVYLTAYQTAGMLAAAHLKREGQIASAPAVATRAREFLPDLLQSLDTLSRLPREEMIKTLGHDPYATTEEQYLEAQKTVLKALGLTDGEMRP
jgi:Putative zinc- or iron-chelating domain